MTIDTQCASALTAIIVAGQAIAAGAASLQIAGGTESASTAPVRSIDGVPYTRAPFAPEGFDDPDMGPAAQTLAIKNQIPRTQQDAYAVRSHSLALAAKQAGQLDAELVALAGVAEDDAPNPKIANLIGRMAPLYVGPEQAHLAVTGGNSSRNSDGAVVVALTSEARRNGAPGLALVDSVTLGKSTDLPGIGPVGAVQELLQRNGLVMDDIAAFEIVEAFGAQTLSVLQALGLAQHSEIDARVCAQGGSLAFGHPWGASGALIVTRLFSRLVSGGVEAGRLGLATVAVGGGMGVAALFEVVR
jgi:acetyl-CoA C-acetyltransferase